MSSGRQQPAQLWDGKVRFLFPIWLLAVSVAVGACSSAGRASSDPYPAPGTEARKPSAGAATTAGSAAPSEVRRSQVGRKGGTVEITLADYTVAPAANSVAPGSVTISVVNRGGVGHNVALVATSLPGDELPTAGVRLDESDPHIRILARTPNVGRGERTTVTVDVDAGSYILVCTVPHHYVRERMLAMLRVQA